MGGRFFSPALGRPPQPHHAVAPPTIPQALNRYAATPVGQPGVASGNGATSGGWQTYLVDAPIAETIEGIIGIGAGKLVDWYSKKYYSHYGRVFVTTHNMRAIGRAGSSQFFYS